MSYLPLDAAPPLASTRLSSAASACWAASPQSAVRGDPRLLLHPAPPATAECRQAEDRRTDDQQRERDPGFVSFIPSFGGLAAHRPAARFT
jgi:hypothetical protein